jgi:hypothetical protein
MYVSHHLLVLLGLLHIRITVLQTLLKLTTTLCRRKFGKQIQKRQLEVPEYAASFVNYKALKKVRRSKSGTEKAMPPRQLPCHINQRIKHVC